MEYEEMEKLSLEESKRQTKERRDRGKNMIRPFTFDEKKYCGMDYIMMVIIKVMNRGNNNEKKND